jgi:hypothetical protein
MFRIKLDGILSPFALQRKYLKLFGLWQIETSTWAYFFYGISVHILLIDFFVISQFLYLLKFNNFEDTTRVVSLAATNFLLVLRSSSFAHHVDEIDELFEEIERANKEFGEEKMSKHARLIDKFCKIVWAIAFVGCSMSIIVPITTHELANHLWYPFDFNASETLFWITAIYQTLNTIIMSGLDIVIEFLPAMFLGFILDMVEKLAKRLETLKKQEKLEDGSREENSEKLKTCIEYHLKIINITKKLQDIFSFVILFKAIVSALILCTSAYSLSMVSSKVSSNLDVFISIFPQVSISQNPGEFVKLSSFLFPIIFGVFLPFYYGNRIEFESEKLSVSFFNSDWYTEDKKYKESGKIFLEVLKRPIGLSIFGIFKVDLRTFGRICNATYSLFAVFKQINSDA